MDHSRDGGFGAGTDVGGGAGDGAGGGKSAEERGDNVGDALRNQFHVGIVSVAAHAVGDDGGHQGFDGAEQRDGDGRGEQGAHMW